MLLKETTRALDWAQHWPITRTTGGDIYLQYI